MATQNLRADRSQRLVVSSRRPETDAPFLDPPRQRGLVDPSEMLNGFAVYRGVVFFTRLVFVITFFLLVGRCATLDACLSISPLLCWR